MGNVSLKVLEISLNFLLKKGMNPAPSSKGLEVYSHFSVNWILVYHRVKHPP